MHRPLHRLEYTLRRLLTLSASVLVVTLACHGQVQACEPASFTVAVDVGHTRAVGGAVSARGVSEYTFNIRLAREFHEALVVEGYVNAFIVDETGADIALRERTARASAQAAALFISIHHDSMQPKYLQSWTYAGKQQRYSRKFSGHSIFISDQVAEAEANLAIAQSLGRALRARGFTPTLHHAEPIKGENRELLDKQLGIYNFPQLYVLRTAQYPALLFEAGIILNPDEERNLNDAAHRGRLVAALLEAVASACGAASRPKRGQ